MNTELKGELKFMSVELVDFKISSITCDNQVICHLNNEKLNDDQVKYFANVFINAGNTIQSCGLLPSELLKHNNDIKNEREVLIKAFSDVTKEFEGRGWIMEGRGPYAYDDDEYRKEVSYLFDAFEKIKAEMWSKIKSKTFEYKNQIEEPLLKQNQEMREMLKKISVALEEIWMAEDGDNIIFDKINAEELDNLIESTNP